jgi:hypothetical protein
MELVFSILQYFRYKQYANEIGKMYITLPPQISQVQWFFFSNQTTKVESKFLKPLFLKKGYIELAVLFHKLLALENLFIV